MVPGSAPPTARPVTPWGSEVWPLGSAASLALTREVSISLIIASRIGSPRVMLVPAGDGCRWGAGRFGTPLGSGGRLMGECAEPERLRAPEDLAPLAGWYPTTGSVSFVPDPLDPSREPSVTGPNGRPRIPGLRCNSSEEASERPWPLDAPSAEYPREPAPLCPSSAAMMPSESSPSEVAMAAQVHPVPEPPVDYVQGVREPATQEPTRKRKGLRLITCVSRGRSHRPGGGAQQSQGSWSQEARGLHPRAGPGGAGVP